MTYVTIPGDCIDRVTAQHRDRVISGRLATPRPAPKVTLKRNWQSQQQQQEQPQLSLSHTDVPSIWKQRRLGKARQKCKTTRNTSQKRIKHLETGCCALSQMDVDIHLSGRQVSQDAFSKNEVVQEERAETNTKAIEIIQFASNKFCIREDLAKEKMVFSLFSRWAIVELVELETSMIQCPSCLYHVSKGQFFADVGSTSDTTWI